jgi:hypothetical protein
MVETASVKAPATSPRSFPSSRSPPLRSSLSPTTYVRVAPSYLGQQSRPLLVFGSNEDGRSHIARRDQRRFQSRFSSRTQTLAARRVTRPSPSSSNPLRRVNAEPISITTSIILSVATSSGFTKGLLPHKVAIASGDQTFRGVGLQVCC